ncbi:hypothetical protein EST38_g8985 [Candolleomyces aberdarensis]|uniref:Uncharacterized protein n=1 Tax=Candolleomyces aberdarensis TaxID=2316362 RepID=A0A4Q2DDA9_9AGAR|nr:hypothetical protein EST38_g8985 [Candolleomyces aberdarensis]
MDPPGEQHSKPRKRNRIKKFLKNPFGRHTPSPSPSHKSSHSTVAGGPGTSSQGVHDVAISSPPVENTTRSEIQSNQDNNDTAISGRLREGLPSQDIQSTFSEAIPSVTAQKEENAFISSTSAFDRDGATPVSNPFSPSERLASSQRAQGEGEPQVTTAHVDHASQALGSTGVEGDLSDLPIQSSTPAAATSHGANEPQEGPAHVDYQPAGLGSKIYEGVKTTLRRIVDVSDVFPPLKSTAAGLLVICETIDAYGENQEEFDALLKRVEVLSRIMDSCPPDVSQEVKDRFDGLLRTLEEKKKILQGKMDPTRSRVERVMLAPQDKQVVLKLTQEIRFAIEIAMFDTVIENRAQTLQIVSGVNWLKERINVMKDHTETMRTIEEAVHSLKRSNTLQKLGRVEGAEYSNAKRGPGCIPGSRVSLLAMLLVWATDPSSPHLFWLSGLAGTGKTTVSKTFCSQLNDRGLLGASFFCTLKESDKRDVYLIIPTLARILAEERPKFGDALEAILESDRSCRNPAEMELKDQYLKLILLPAEKTFAANELLVLGVDALDECEDRDAVKLFIAAIVSQKPTVPLKVFLTSRPEISLRESFDSSTQHGWLRLHDIEADIVKADILLYLNVRFKGISRVYNHYQANWPPPEIQTIGNVSGPLFIVAATMATYIATYSGNCLKRFQELGQPSANVQLSGIEALYSRILAEVFTDLEQEEADMIYSCLSLLITAQKPISVDNYAKLLGTDTLTIREAFKSLHSVVQVPDEGCDDAFISIFHASFVDYLTSARQHGKNWAIDKTAAHHTTADLCFAIMDSMLYFGVSGAKTSYQSNDNQPEPLELASELAYACTAWGNHVLYAEVTGPLQQRMLEFVKTKKVLHWVEALSVVKNVKYAYNMLWQISKEILKLPMQQNPDCVVFSPDCKYIGSGLKNGTIQLWNAQTGQLALEPIQGHTGWVTSVAFSPDGRYIVSGSDDETIGLWDIQTGKPVLESIKEHIRPVTSVAFSPDCKYIVSGSDDKTIRLWNAQTGQQALEPITGHIWPVTSVAFSPDGKYIVSGSKDCTIRMWDVQTGQPVLESIKGHSNVVTSVVFSPDGKYIVSGSWDKTIRLWDSKTGQPALRPIEGHTNRVTSVTFSPDGQYILSGSDDKTIRLWNTQTGQPSSEPIEEHTGSVRTVAFSPNGKYIVSGSFDNTIRLWNAQTKQPNLEPIRGHTNIITSVAFSSDSKYIVSGSWDKAIRVWDAQTGQLALEPTRGHDGWVTSVAFSPDGKNIVSGSWDETIRLWDVQTGQLALQPIIGHTNTVTSVAFSPDCKYIVSGSFDTTIRLWNAQTGQPALEPMRRHTKIVTSVAFSSDGKYIVSGSEDSTIRLWDAQTGQPIREPIRGHTNGITSVAFSPDGKYMVSGSQDKTVRLWDSQTGQSTLEPMEGHTNWITSVAFSSDGQYIVSGSKDKTIRLWDAHTGQPALDPIKGHTHSVTSVAFSPDNQHIVSGSDDRTIQMWSICHAQLAYQDHLFLHDHFIAAFSLNNDGWIQDSSDNLLLWVPPHCRDGLYRNGTRHIIGDLQTTKVELTNATYHGADWLKTLLVVLKYFHLGLQPL